jgi:hypothetical protein
VLLLMIFLLAKRMISMHKTLLTSFLAVTGNTILQELKAKAKSLVCEQEGDFTFHIRVYGDCLSKQGDEPTGIWALRREFENDYYKGRCFIDYESKITATNTDCYSNETNYPHCKIAFETFPLRLPPKYGPYGLIDASRNRICENGFGTYFVTYRNCPNNAPPALWWTRDGWIPLFPRT